MVTVIPAPTGEELEFEAGSVTGVSGLEVVVPIRVKRFTDILTFQFSMHWDLAVLGYVGVEGAALSGLAEGSFGTTEASNGTLTVSWDDPNGTGASVEDGTAVFDVRLKVIGVNGVSSSFSIDGSPTTMEASDRNTQVVSVAGLAGQITVASALNIAGTVNYYSGTKMVPGVTVALTGDQSNTVTTGVDGAFSFEVDAGGGFTLTPSKATEIPVSQGVTTLDIALIRRHILDSRKLDSPYKLLAGDVNNSSTLTTLDIALIRRVILGSRDSFSGGLWVFVPSDFEFSNPLNPWPYGSVRSFSGVSQGQTGQDFVGIRHGDVNASWTAPAGSVASTATASTKPEGIKTVGLMSSAPNPGLVFNGPVVTFEIGEEIIGGTGNESARNINRKSGMGNPKLTADVPVHVSGFAGVTSAQFTMEWNPRQAAFAGVSDFGGIGLGSENFGTRYVDEGKLTFSWDNPQGFGLSVEDGHVLFMIKLRPTGEGVQMPVRFADNPTIREVSIEGSRVQMQTVDGSIGGAIENDGDQRLGFHIDVNGGLKELGAERIFRVTVPTVEGRSYVLESVELLAEDEWREVDRMTGDGTVRAMTDAVSSSQQRFYRIREE